MRRWIPAVALLLGVGLGWSLHPGPSVSFSEAVQRLRGGQSVADYALLNRVWDSLHAQYVDTSVNDSTLLEGMLTGLVGGLNDPYSAYLPPSDASSLDSELSGRVEGIGAEIGAKDGRIVVIAPLPDSPAEKAGVKAGDAVLAIDNRATDGLSLDEAVSRIRGAAGSSVELVLRADGASERTVTIVRATVRVESVVVTEEPGGTGKGPILSIRLRSFTSNTGRELVQALNAHLGSKPSGIVLDLEDNPGGYLESAIDVTSEFVRDGLVVIEAGRDGRRTEHRVRGTPLVPDVPMVVLVNHGSASAAEIVAGALQDAGRATVLGTTSFGKGSVQTLEQLPNGAELRLTVARWLTPKGRSIDRKGITPDTVVEDDPATSAVEPLQAALKQLRG